MDEEKFSWSELLKAFPDFYTEELEEETYLKELASKYVLKDPKNYASVRSIVLDIHFRLEAILNNAISWYLCFYNKKRFIFSKDCAPKVADAISNIDYSKKLSVIKALNIFSPQAIKIFWKVNDLRVAFAHNYKKDNPKYLYNGVPIFKRKPIDELIADLKTVISEFVDFIEGDEDKSAVVPPSNQEG